jgi:hypothetical protein
LVAAGLSNYQMKQRKIAISLAVIGAIAAPFVTGAWKMTPKSFTPLSAEREKKLTAYIEKTKNCATAEDQFYCENWPRKALRDGGEFEFSEPKYLALNLATALAGFVVIFGLAYLLPAIGRRYWRWLNT